MKKLVVAVLLSGMAFSLVGCSASAGEATESVGSSPEATVSVGSSTDTDFSTMRKEDAQSATLENPIPLGKSSEANFDTSWTHVVDSVTRGSDDLLKETAPWWDFVPPQTGNEYVAVTFTTTNGMNSEGAIQNYTTYGARCGEFKAEPVLGQAFWTGNHVLTAGASLTGVVFFELPTAQFDSCMLKTTTGYMALN